MSIRLFRAALVGAVCLAAVTASWADGSPFDLTGPTLEVKVMRSGKTLPISEVPNLEAGDRVWIRADLPEAQSARYLMIATFLRGSTNPPPENWFFRQETWDRRADEKGLTVTVPEGAQQVVIFLAPETNGDFRTLVNAVQGQPGAFVRASQDLNQAMLDRTRLDAYLAAIRKLNESDPTKLATATPLLARSLGMRIDESCLQKMPELQAACLTAGQNTLILSDGHSESIVEAVTSGPASDLAMQLSATPQADYGFYSPYVGSAMDIARILDSFRTAQYQYIPALAVQQGDRLSLMLNTPPSFHNPKSVLVTALPAVEASQPPPLHPVDSEQNYCAEKNSLVLAVDGAPLVFSTGYAHDMDLRLKTKTGRYVEVPLKPDAEQGGLVLESKNLSASDFGSTIDASLEGAWGFSKFDGPAFRLQNTQSQHWELAPADRESLVVGKADTLQLSADDATCVDTVVVKDSSGKVIKASWKATSPDRLEVTLPLAKARPGPMLLEVKQYGAVTAQALPLRAFAEAGHLNSFTIHAGDTKGVLKGTRLDEVANLTFEGVTFSPEAGDADPASDKLTMGTKSQSAAAKLKEGATGTALVTLLDGREMTVSAAVGAPRPSVELIGKSVQDSGTSAASNIQLSGQDELPQDAQLTFSIRAQSPAQFASNESIEVATEDEAFTAMLNMANGGLTLENRHVALATLDPAKAFGGSAFGPLRFRVIDNGVKGDWMPLATLVRLPVLHHLKCPNAASQPCRLSGSDLFLVEAVASDPQFTSPVEVPDGFPGYMLPVPHPEGGELYVKLRDDPTVVNQITLAAEQLRLPGGMGAAAHSPRPAYNPGSAAPAPGAPPGTAGAETSAIPAGNSAAAAPQPKPTTPPASNNTQPAPQSGGQQTNSAPAGQSAGSGPASSTSNPPKKQPSNGGNPQTPQKSVQSSTGS